MDHSRDVRVLIAEDDYLVSEMVRGLLEEKAYVIVGEAANGREALELTRTLQPDVVLMDIKMPDMDGIEAARSIYRDCPVPVVVLTAYETPELVEQASAAGVGAYLVKPPNAQEIEGAINVAMARFGDLMKLRRLNAELKARNAELDAFSHTVAHNLKSQLAPLIGYAEMLDMDYLDVLGSNGAECVRRILKVGRKLGNIVDELLLLAQLRAVEVPIVPLDMGRLVAEAQHRLIYMVQEKQAEVIFPNSWPIVLGHGPWVEEVWVNYLSNGLKYGGNSKKGLPPRLELGCGPTHSLTGADDVCFWVRDNGPGIASEEQALLFTPFTQLYQIRARGYGLGLSIVQSIVQKLGGQVGVNSRAGAGSTFWFTLPVAK
jgi:two-component system, sensor histidine kinase and response regulator